MGELKQKLFEERSMREPTEKDIANAGRWLIEAQRKLSQREFHRVKQLCRQIERVLNRKDKN